MTQRDIFKKMEQYFKEWIESDGEDESYNELYHAFYTLKCAQLIPDELFEKIVKKDSEIYKSYSN